MVLFGAFNDPQDVFNFISASLLVWLSWGMDSHAQETVSRALLVFFSKRDEAARAWAKAIYTTCSFLIRFPLILCVFLYFQTPRPTQLGGHADNHRNTIVWLIVISFLGDMVSAFANGLKFPVRAFRTAFGMMSYVVSLGSAALALVAWSMALAYKNELRDAGFKEAGRNFFFAVYGIYALSCVAFWFFRLVGMFYSRDMGCCGRDFSDVFNDEWHTQIGSGGDGSTEGLTKNETSGYFQE